MSISFQELAQDCVSFQTLSNMQPNQLCCMHSNNIVKSCSDNSPIHGQVVAVRSGVASVVVRGFITAGYSGTAPTVGFCPLVAYNNKSVKVSDGAKEYLVVNVDTTNKTVCFML